MTSRNPSRYQMLSLVLVWACCFTAHHCVCVGTEPRIVFTHDTSNQVGNIFDMLETENGGIVVAGYYGMVFLDRDYKLVRKKKINGAFRNVELARFADGIGMVGFNNKPMSDELRIPHLLKIGPDLGDFTETRICDTCENIGVADFDGDGIDSVVIAGKSAFTLYDIANDQIREISTNWFDTRLYDFYRVTETDFDCNGREELFFRAGYVSIREQENEWRTDNYFTLLFDGKEYQLTDYQTYLKNNWRRIRVCESTVKQKDPLGIERYFEHRLVSLSPGNVGDHYTDSPVQKHLKLVNVSNAEALSWEVRLTGMRRALNFYPLIDTECMAQLDSSRENPEDCQRFLSVYAIYGYGCEQWFWEKDDCGTWILLLSPDSTWETVATWPHWSFASLLTSDGRLLIHSVAELLEINLPENLKRPDN